MAFKKPCILVNDVLEELSEENKRLLNELLFANKSVELLSQFKSFIDLISYKFEQNLDSNESQTFEKLNEEINEFMRECEIFEDKSVQKFTHNFTKNDNNFEIIEIDSDFGDNSYDYRLDDKNGLNSHSMVSRVECGSKAKSKKSGANSTNYLFGSQLFLQKTTNDYVIKSEEDFDEIPTANNEWSEEYPTNELDLNASSTNNGFNYKTNTNAVKRKNTGMTCRGKQAGKGPHKCSHCGKRFLYKESLRKHVTITHQVLDEQLICEIDNCNKQYKTRISLTTHQRIHHFMEKKFVCDYPNCGFRFAYENLLDSHKTTHSDDKPFVCTHEGCHKGFKNQYYLNSHLKSHSTEDSLIAQQVVHYVTKKRFVCDYPGCDFEATTESRLNTHKISHSEDRPYVCPRFGCHKTFKAPSQLKNHAISHRNERRFRCTYEGCGMAYKRNSHLKRHVQNSHQR